MANTSKKSDKKREIKGHIIIDKIRRPDEELEEYEDEVFKIKKSLYKEIKYIKTEDLQNKEKLVPINQEIDLSQKYDENNKFVLVMAYTCERCNQNFYPELRFRGNVVTQRLCPKCRSPYWQTPRERKIYVKNPKQQQEQEE